MDAAQMLTAAEIARQCQRQAREATEPVPAGRHLSLASNAADATAHGDGIPVVGVPKDEVSEGSPRAGFPDAGTPNAGKAGAPTEAEPGSEPCGDAALTDAERGLLAFEGQWWKRSGAKERAIRELFDMSVTRYYQVLNGVLDKPEAARVEPLLIKRLRRVRASRQRARAARRLGIELH